VDTSPVSGRRIVAAKAIASAYEGRCATTKRIYFRRELVSLRVQISQLCIMIYVGSSGIHQTPWTPSPGRLERCEFDIYLPIGNVVRFRAHVQLSRDYTYEVSHFRT
jgi:hypothetical protein